VLGNSSPSEKFGQKPFSGKIDGKLLVFASIKNDVALINLF